MMDLDEIVAEMHRKPDAHALVGWIDEIACDVGSDLTDEISEAIAAYREALDS